MNLLFCYDPLAHGLAISRIELTFVYTLDRFDSSKQHVEHKVIQH